MKKLTKEKLFQLLTEDINNVIFEDDETTFLQKNYETLSSTLKEYIKNLTPEDKKNMDFFINSAIRRGNTDITYNFYQKNPKAFNYFVDTLATIVKNNLSGAENAKQSLFHVFSPFSKQSSGGEIQMSDFFRRVSRFATNQIQGSKSSDFTHFISDDNKDNLIDAIYSGFEKALKYFNPELGTSFNSLISTAVSNYYIDLWRKQNQFQIDGEKFVKQTDSMDSPIGDDEESGNLGDTMCSPEMGTERTLEKRENTRIWNAISSFIKHVLRKSKNENLVKVYELYTEGDYDLEEIANALGTTNGNIRQLKMRAEDMIKPYIQDGTMANFVYKATGAEIGKIPFVIGKKSDMERFVFPRMSNEKAKKKKDNKIAAEGLEFNIDNIIKEENGKYIVDFTSFYNPEHYENINYAEYTKMVVNEGFDKLRKLNITYHKIEKLINTINEAYNGNYNIDSLDLFDNVKSYVSESIKIIDVFYEEILKLDRVAYDIQGEYPLMSEEMAKTIIPINKELEKWPNQLKFMLEYIRRKYNAKNAFGI